MFCCTFFTLWYLVLTVDAALYIVVPVRYSEFVFVKHFSVLFLECLLLELWIFMEYRVGKLEVKKFNN